MGNFSTNPKQLDILAASFIVMFVYFDSPIWIFSSTETSKRKGFWGTIEIDSLRSIKANFLISTPSNLIDPSVGSWKRQSILIKVDLPAPLGPTNATVSPAFTKKSTFLKAEIFVES